MGFGSGGTNKTRPKHSKGHSKKARKVVNASFASRKKMKQQQAEKTAAAVAAGMPASSNPKRLTVKEAEAEGKIPVTEQMYRTYFLICYQQRFDEPAEQDWPALIKVILSEVGGKADSVRRVFKEAQKGNVNCTDRKKGSGRPLKLKADNPGLVAAALALNVGVVPSLATEICNSVNSRTVLYRDVSVCRNTLMSTMKHYTDVQKCAILRRKTGSKDPNAAWAQTRLILSEQLCFQFDLGIKIDNGSEWIADHTIVRPLWKDGIFAYDQSHSKCTIAGAGHSGANGNIQYRVGIDPTTGALKPIRSGGRLPKRRRRVVPKYTQESRGGYGCCCPVIDGEVKAQMSEPYDYSGKKLLSVKATKAKLREIANNYRQRGGRDAAEWRPYRDTDNPFIARYGEAGWEEEAKKTAKFKKFADICDMISNIIDEGTKCFAGSTRKDTWMIYHDRLNILWETETVEHMKSLKCPIEWDPQRTWFDRFIKLSGEWNDRVTAKRYQNSLVGDSPELMPLDNHLFADVDTAVARNIAFSYHLPEDDPRKYSAATPNRMFESIRRTIANGVPRPERIVEDMHRIPDQTLQRIIDAAGCFIEDHEQKSRKGNRKDAQREHVKAEKERLHTLDESLVEAMQTLHYSIADGTAAMPIILEEDAVVVDEDDDVVVVEYVEESKGVDAAGDEDESDEDE